MDTCHSHKYREYGEIFILKVDQSIQPVQRFVHTSTLLAPKKSQFSCRVAWGRLFHMKPWLHGFSSFHCFKGQPPQLNRERRLDTRTHNYRQSSKLMDCPKTEDVFHICRVHISAMYVSRRCKVVVQVLGLVATCLTVGSILLIQLKAFCTI